MFALGFLLFGVVFLVALFLVSKLISPRWRAIFVAGVLGFIVAYPFLHNIRPSYAKFKELCARAQQPTILRTRQIDFILIEHGFPSNCTKGPEFIRNRSYLGFDCNKIVGSNSSGRVTELHRYTMKKNSGMSCGLECFTDEKIAAPETLFGFLHSTGRSRHGYLAGDERVVTSDYPSLNEKSIPFWRWLRFIDFIIVDGTDGDMAYSTRYSYLPYGPLAILGLASGTPPTEQCPFPESVDPRDVYKPRKQ